MNIDLTGAYLGGANLSGLDLSGAKLDNVHWSGTHAWTAPDRGWEKTGPGESWKFDWTRQPFAPKGAKVGTACIKDTKFPDGYRAPENGDCSSWGYFPQIEGGNGVLAVGFKGADSDTFADDDITVKQGDRPVFLARLHTALARSLRCASRQEQRADQSPHTRPASK